MGSIPVQLNLIEYSVEQLAGHCVIMIDIVYCNTHAASAQLEQRRKLLDYYYYTKLIIYDHIALQVPPYYTLSYMHSNTRVIITSFHLLIPVPEQMSTSTVSTKNNLKIMILKRGVGIDHCYKM